MAKSMQFAFNDWKLQGLEGHTSGVKVIGANEYQRILATGSKDRTVKLWSLDIHRTIENPDYADAGSGCLMTYNGHRRGAVYDLHFATGGGSFGTGDIVASCDGQIHVSILAQFFFCWLCPYSLLIISQQPFSFALDSC